MIKLFSEIIRAKVILANERAYVGYVKDIVISDEDGTFLGVSCTDELGRKIKYIPSVEFKGFGPDSIIVNGYDSLSDLDDLVRLKEVVDRKIKIIKSSVITKEGKKVGKVNEATINLKHMALERIFVTPVLRIKNFAKDLIIPAKSIEQILPNKIIIAEDVLKTKKKAVIMSPATVVD